MNIKSRYIILFSILYILCELTFNLGLVDFVSSKNTEITTFQALETFGRILSSIGFTLIIIRYISKYIQNIMALLVGFAISVIAFYSMQSLVFNAIINNLTIQQKYGAYVTGVYNNLQINNKITGIISTTQKNNKNNYYSDEYYKVATSMFGVVAYEKTKDSNIQNVAQEFFNVNNTSIDLNMLGQAYDKLNPKNDLEKLWGIYLIKSRMYEQYIGFGKSKLKQKFIDTIGIEPGLSKDAFYQEINAKYLSGNTDSIKNQIIIPGNDKIKLSPLTIGDIPKDLSKEQWVKYIDDYYKNASEKTRLDIKNLSYLPYSDNIISATVIVPIAITLSLLALLLNVVSLLWKWKKSVSVAFTAIIAGVFLSSMLFNPFNLSLFHNGVMTVEATLNKVFSPYSALIHKTFINDDKPNSLDVIRIEKPKNINVNNLLSEKLKQLESLTGNQENGKEKVNKIIDNEQLKVDPTKANRSNYYGEIDKINPYLKK